VHIVRDKWVAVFRNAKKLWVNLAKNMVGHTMNDTVSGGIQ